ncbi:MAG: hypothetical protein JMN24_02625 [gamma proteobacterium endosymbiont of Lamellibrachia anaximandri]|nr:hypothetical protein [gamma proteobacterium endosymbiont of Lamellibrachia anaximandri]
MFDYNETPPGGGGSYNQLDPWDRLWVYLKLLLIFGAEKFNWLLHTSNYALVNTVGADLFVLDVLGLPDIYALSNISVGTLINGILGLAAVATPVFLFSQLLERHHEIFSDPKGFFSDGLNAIVTALFTLLYFFVIFTEFATLYMRVLEESAPSPIPELAGSEANFWPMLIMSIALIITNAAMGLATAHVLRATKKALRGA